MSEGDTPQMVVLSDVDGLATVENFLLLFHTLRCTRFVNLGFCRRLPVVDTHKVSSDLQTLCGTGSTGSETTDLRQTI